MIVSQAALQLRFSVIKEGLHLRLARIAALDVLQLDQVPMPQLRILRHQRFQRDVGEALVELGLGAN